jgi:uncharacterized protein (DUF1330 family)
LAASIVAQLDVNKTNWQKAYGPKVGPWCRNRGKMLAGAGATLERFDGKGPLPSVMLLLESPPLEQVKVWYHDPENAHMMQLRQTARMRTVPS